MDLNVSVVCKNIDEVDQVLLYLDSIGRTWENEDPYRMSGISYELIKTYLRNGYYLLVNVPNGSFKRVLKNRDLDDHEVTFTEFFTPYGKQVTIGSGRVTT